MQAAPFAAASKTTGPELYKSAIAGRGMLAAAGPPGGGPAGGSGGIGTAATCDADECRCATSLAAAPTSIIGLLISGHGNSLLQSKQGNPWWVALFWILPFRTQNSLQTCTSMEASSERGPICSCSNLVALKLGRGGTFCRRSPDRDFVCPAGLWVVQQCKFCQRQACICHYVRQVQVDSPFLTPERQQSMSLSPSSGSTTVALQDIQARACYEHQQGMS